jgi:hypothetical protein
MREKLVKPEPLAGETLFREVKGKEPQRGTRFTNDF